MSPEITYLLSILFLTIFYAVYYLGPANRQNDILAAANLLFLVSLGPSSALTCLFCALTQFYFYNKIRNTDPASMTKKTSARRWTTIAILAQAVTLITYKAMAANGSPLPIGISYYSLMLVGLQLSTLWKRSPLELDFAEFFTSTTYFPILMMGPIEKIEKLVVQLRKNRKFDITQLQKGIYWALIGSLKIFAVSNFLEKDINHSLASQSQLYGLGIFAYCFLSFLKLYAEFSGFTDIMYGLSTAFGLEITKNFDQPYFAKSLNDIWKRWHISLTNWLREFIYFPVLLKTRHPYTALLCVVLFAGAWHGTNIGYAYWIAYWIGVALAVTLLGKIKIFQANLKLTPLRILATVSIISLSTACFMIEYFGFSNLLSRMINLELKSLSSYLTYCHLSQTEIWQCLIGVGMMILFETFDRMYSEKFISFRIIALSFLISFLGKFETNIFLYLRF